ncbi:unnamed protein product [Diabrotica balteata]|uniref:Ig-like domain-containing protein n=1 Tax=Diabrotica balteata TaxID=107213 RepID=A0A9P0E628_DIABA|nr:unnamed protein product [Diabrotica balteata]
MDKFKFVLIVGFLSCAYSTIIIKDMTVPQSISLNSSVDHADFDCNYEAVNESDIEVKWFFNGNVEQVYQWLPGYNTTGYGMNSLRDKLDIEYKVTNDSDTEYRGFRIKHIGRELTGNYTCKVSSETNEAYDTRQMVIYTPVQSGLDLVLLSNDALVICMANGISPMPEVHFSLQSENGTKIDLTETVEMDDDNDGYYNITATHNFASYNHTLKGPTKFLCNVSIPGTSYFLTKEIIHVGNEEPLTNVTVAEDLTNMTMTRIEIAEEIVNTTHRGTASIIQISASLSILLLSLLLMLD